MLTFAEFIQLQEARKNPELNPKISPMDYIQYRLENCDKLSNGKPNLFASFTNIDKLGVNPKSDFNTPIGIYSYPADYVVKQVKQHGGNMRKLPFAGNSPFVSIFSIGGNVVDLTKMTTASNKKYYQQLEKLYPNIPVKEIIIDKREYYRNAPEGAKFYYTTKEIAMRLSKDNFIVRWNGIFRKLGIDALYDPGKGLIHHNEETQCVAFSLSSIEYVYRSYNKWADDSEKNGEESKEKNMKLIDIYNSVKELGKEKIISKLKEIPEIITVMPKTYEPDFIKEVLPTFDESDLEEFITENNFILSDGGVKVLIDTFSTKSPSFITRYLYSYFEIFFNHSKANRKIGDAALRSLIDFFIKSKHPEFRYMMEKNIMLKGMLNLNVTYRVKEIFDLVWKGEFEDLEDEFDDEPE